MTAQLSTLPPLPLWLLAAAGLLVLVVWMYLWLFHHRFWTTRIPPAVTEQTTAAAAAWQPAVDASATMEQASAAPAVLVVIPARNEAEVIARTVADVLSQNYEGALHLVVVNDNSQDETATLAEHAATETLATLPPQLAAQRRFSLINGTALPEGWSGKLWALEQGIRHGLGSERYAQQMPAATDATQQTQAVAQTANGQIANTAAPTQGTAGTQHPNAISAGTQDAQTANAQMTRTSGAAQYVWLTDADIAHRPQVLRELVSRARRDNRALVSRMALLCTDTAAERWTIPAFVYFFQMLYPFAAIADPRSGIHGAAGGCILLERAYLEKIGGIGSLRGALIDDCTLASHVARAGGRLWLELTQDSVSQRGYGGAQGVSDMIARTAYTQLRYCPLRLTGTVFGLVFTFFCPLLLPLATIALLLATSAPTQTADTATVASPATMTAADASAAFASQPALLADAITTQLPAILAIGCPLAAAAIMFGTVIPMLRFYGRSPLRALALPVIASFYLSATIKSAVRHYRGKTGNWKGRVYQKG